MSEVKLSLDESTNKVALPEVYGVVYTVSGKPVKGELTIDRPTVVSVSATQGFVLHKSIQRSYVFTPIKDVEEVSKTPDPAPVDAEPVETTVGSPSPKDASPRTEASDTENYGRRRP